MKLIKQEDFAVLLMSELAKNYGKKLVSLSEVASTHGVSVLFLKKIARLLRGAGLIVSKEGVTGGYALAKAPNTISVWDVLRAASGRQDTQSLSKSPCPLYTRCLPQRINKTIEESVEKSLRTILLHQLAI
ncbi:Rrf2 family transcriptional regulator [Candidatus Gottesmanbacteria bacterium]|nr:Rrf2 family transcriptional regulator [Candidatus Gottesmanbacteria bacterium]